MCWELIERQLSNQEEKRIGSFLILAANKIDEKINKGEKIREDWFQTEKIAGGEILEGVLTVAQHDYEERKIKYYANLFTNLAFNTKIDKHEANFFIKVAESLNYRDLCLLRIAGIA